MKAVKIILGIITVLVVGFFLTGLLVKETNYTAQVSINKNIKEVFKIFNKPENIKNWIPEVTDFEVVKENPGKIGSIYKVKLDNIGEEFIMTQKVMSYVENEKVTLFFDAENMLKTNDYVFTEKDGVTTITLNASCQSDSYVMACLFPYFKETFRGQDQTYLNYFKEFVEK